MRFGWTLRGGPGVGEEARESELAGFDVVGAADTQSLLPDVYCSLTQAALATDRVCIAPWVTNVSTRLPVVTAGAIATIDQISGGRALLAIGTGRSSTANAGLRPATPDELSRALTTIASAFRPVGGAREEIEWPRGLRVDERVVALPGWATRRVPIYVAASGPRALRVACELADGVVLSPGDITPTSAARRIAELRRWRDEGPRADDPFDIWQNLRCHVSTSVADGRASLRNVVSAHAAYAKVSEMPPELRDAQRRYLDQYRWDHHGGMNDPVNALAMNALGLSDHMFERYAIIGDLAEVTAEIRQLKAAGLDGVAGAPPNVVAAHRGSTSDRTSLQSDERVGQRDNDRHTEEP